MRRPFRRALQRLPGGGVPCATRRHFLTRRSAGKLTPAKSTFVPFTPVWTSSFGAIVLMFWLFLMVLIFSISPVVSSRPPALTAETVMPPYESGRPSEAEERVSIVFEAAYRTDQVKTPADFIDVAQSIIRCNPAARTSLSG